MNAAEIARACDAIAAQIVADAADPTALAIVGVVCAARCSRCACAT